MIIHRHQKAPGASATNPRTAHSVSEAVGKTSLVERLDTSRHEDTRSQQQSENNEQKLHYLKDRISMMFSGHPGSKNATNNLLQFRLDGIDNAQNRLAQPEPEKSSLLGEALSLGVSITAGLLIALT